MNTPCKDCPDRQRNEAGVTICQNSSACEKWAKYEADKELYKHRNDLDKAISNYHNQPMSKRSQLDRRKYGKRYR